MQTYDKQTERVLGAGLNLLAPGDLVGQAQAITFDNFRSYQDGSIRSRKGRGASLATGAGTVTSIAKTASATPTWYIGGGGTLTPVGGGGAAVSGFGTSHPIRMTGMDGWLWATTQSKQIKHNGTAGVRWIPEAPTSITLTPIAGGGPLLIGKVYTYYVTFVTADGHESGAASASFIPDNPNQIVQITLPSSADPQVTGCNVYRTGNTLNNAYLINPSPVDEGSTYEDSGEDSEDYHQSDDSLLRLGITLVSNVGDPPPAKGCAGPYFGHLLMWNSAAHPNRLWWSASWKPWAFPGAAYDAGNWVDVGDEGEEILDVSLFPRMAVIYKTNSIWRIAGDPDDEGASVEQVSGGVGLAAIMARARAGAVDYLLAGDGVYRMNGDAAVKASLAIDPVLRSESADTPFGLNGIATSKPTACMAHRNGRVYLSYPEYGQSSNTRTLVFDVGRDKWVSDSRAFSALFDEGPGGSLLGAIGTALVGVEDNGTSDNGTAIHLMYQTGYLNQGHPENEKVYADLVIEANTGGANIVASLIYNSGATSEAIGTLNSSSRTLFTFPVGTDDLGAKARNVAVRLEGDAATDAQVVIYNAILHYYVLPRPAKTIDTDLSDWGTPNFKDVDLIHLDVNLPGAATLKVTGSTTYTKALTSTAGRTTLTIPVPNITGRLIRVTLQSETAFYFYGAQIRMLPLGLAFDGANSETFRTEPSAIAA